MKIIGYKKNYVFLMYIFTIAVVTVMLLFDFTSFKNNVSLIILLIAIVVIALSLFQLILYFSTPKYPIQYENGKLYLPNKKVVSLKEINDVSYKCARAKNVRYKWGKIIIFTNTGNYQIRFINDCEMVSKEITRLVYNAKQEEEEY